MAARIVTGVVAMTALVGALAEAPTVAAGSHPSVESGNWSLAAVDGVAPNDIWAVGYVADRNLVRITPLAMHWDGHAWSEVATPKSHRGEFFSVAAVASDDVWAVGMKDYQAHTLVEHWDGKTWKIVESPSHVAGRNRLTDVGFISSDDAFASGYSDGNEDPTLPIRLHWDGESWSYAPTSYVGLAAVDAISATDAWGVGQNPQDQTLTRRWTGEHWKTVTSRDVAASDTLTKVDMISADSAWALGETLPDHVAFAEHWDGTQWSTVDLNLQPDSVATAIGGSADDDVWVTGYTNVGATKEGFLQHWDGNTWSRVRKSGIRGYDSRLAGVATFSATDAWAVGTSRRCPTPPCSLKQVLQHWDGNHWRPYRNP